MRRRGDIDVGTVARRLKQFIRERHRNAAGPTAGHHVIHGLCHNRQTLDLRALGVNGHSKTAIILPRLSKLRSDLARKLDAMFQRRIRLERLTLNLLEQVGTPAQEFMMRELPRLHVRGSALRTWCAVDLVKAVHVQLADKTREVVVLEVRTEDCAAELADILHDEASKT